MTTTTTNPLTGLPVGVELGQVLRLATHFEAEGQHPDAAYAQAVAILTPAPGPDEQPNAPLHIEERDQVLVLRRGKKYFLALDEHELERIFVAGRRLLARRRSTRKHQDVRTWERRYDR
jgi:hypothetical protein